MADREPTVIERMQDAWTSHDGTPEECMLAAVRELEACAEQDLVAQGIVVDHLGRAEAAGYLRNVIRQHERRSEGKGE